MNARTRGLLLGVLAIATVLLTSTMASWAQETATLLPRFISKLQNGRASDYLAEQDFVIQANAQDDLTLGAGIGFDLSTLPKGACVTNWTLRLYVKKPGQYFQTMRAYRLKFSEGRVPNLGSNSLSVAKVTSEDRMAEFNYKIKPATDGSPTDPVALNKAQCQWLNPNDPSLALALHPETVGPQYEYFGLASSCAGESSPCNTQPRLGVRYFMPPGASDANWLQGKYDAQQSSQTFWKTSNNESGLNDPVAVPVTGNIKQPPVMYKGGLIFHTQQASGGSEQYFINAIDDMGHPLWGEKPVGIPAVPKRPLAVDKQGRVYVVTQDCLLILNAEDNGKILTPVAGGGGSCKGKSLESLASATPTIGANGAVYLPTDGGIFAFTPYPELKVLWSFGTDGSYGQVALSRDEATAYVNASGKLLAIDAADGRERWSGDAANTTSVPVVGVGKQQEQELIYVAGTGGLKAFRAPSQAITQKSITPEDLEKANVSQPIATRNGQVYFVRKKSDRIGGVDGQFCWWSEKASKVRCASSVKRGGEEQPGDGTNLSSLLAADGMGNVYVIDVTRQPQRVLKFIPTMPVPPAEGAITEGRLLELLCVDKKEDKSPPAATSGCAKEAKNFGNDNILVGVDGTIFNSTQSSLLAMRPKAQDVKIELDSQKVAAQNETTFLAQTRIEVQGGVEVPPAKSFILEAGETIAFKPNVKVKKGAQFSCRIRPTLK